MRSVSGVNLNDPGNSVRGTHGDRGAEAYNGRLEVLPLAGSTDRAREVESILAFTMCKAEANLSTFYVIICKLFEYHRSKALIRVLE